MKNVKRVVIYPRPKDVDAFEHVYQLSMCPWLLRGWQNQDDCNKIRLPFMPVFPLPISPPKWR